MKTLSLTLAAALVASTSAFAGNNSYSTGDGGYVNSGPVDQTLFGGSTAGEFDMEPTASIGTIDTNQVHTVDEYVNGRSATIKFTLNEDGSRDVISKSFRSSNR